MLTAVPSGRRSEKNATPTSTRQFTRTPTARALVIVKLLMASTVAASTEPAARTSLITAVGPGPLGRSEVTVAPLQRFHCWVRVAKSASAATADASATTDSVTEITFTFLKRAVHQFSWAALRISARP